MRKFLKITALVLLLLAVAAGGFAYWQAWKDNVNPKLKEGFALYIPKGSTYEDVIRSLEEQQVLQSVSSFKLIAGDWLCASANQVWNGTSPTLAP